MRIPSKKPSVFVYFFGIGIVIVALSTLILPPWRGVGDTSYARFIIRCDI